MNHQDNPYISLAKTLPLTELPEHQRKKEIYIGRRGFEYCHNCLKRITDSYRAMIVEKTNGCFCSNECRNEFR